MGNKWIDCELGDVIELKRGYDLPKTTRLAGRIPVVSSSGESGFHNESKVIAPGVITGRYGTIGEVFYLDTDFWPLNTTLYVRDFKGNDPLFIYYFLKTISYSDYTDKAAVPGINRNHIHKAKVKIPECVDYQQEISKHLRDLDNKITLNRQINQTLEQMAQALFKSWFVDFDPVVDNALDAGFFEQNLEFSDELLRRVEARKAVRDIADFKPLPDDIRQQFPSAFEECSEPSLGLGGWMPEGWVYDCFSELLSSTIGGDWGKDSQDEKHTTQSRIVRGTDIPDLISGQLSNAPLRWVDPKKLQSRQIEAGDIIIEVSGGSPTQSTGRSIFMTQSMLNRLGGVVEPASFCRRFKPKSFCLGVLASLHLQAIYSDGKMWEYQNQSTGIANFQTKFFLEAERVLMPSDKVLENFCQIVTPLIEKSQNSEQVALAKLRDTLLPKLISGELCIGDSEVDTAEEVLA
ncbi:restriction endonuclease subunit S [Yersinia mollaretii]|uniref:restriction endonuclease subunit S n=1 Tax=Yersinia mollaretii TaxID=33060 RepID=UPI0025AB21E9|nr:restriction endonuclease subunit S [Yersinia mollaretii]MDN0111234.1 restriction endonuclease subunit S [Yersinia mollaretii]HDL8054952.1 restriction endonuclease subunit S [Yersinia enterocolitica]HDL8322661.1 restriction endonuclease subunit S [Yersinia enterocolitica]HEI6926149.1 restriction endonuclease subunit S [Yersinia enterocolitica]